jgi:hypothetical protein
LRKYSKQHISFFIFIFLSLLSLTQAPEISECLPVHTCEIGYGTQATSVKCSRFGRCYFELIKFAAKQNNYFEGCVCDKGITNDPGNTEVACCYQKKSQFLAFFLEFLIGFGIGHFYIGNPNLGFLKMLTYIIICCSGFTIAFCFSYKDGDTRIRDNYIKVLKEESNTRKRSSNNREKENVGIPFRYKVFNLTMIICLLIWVIWQLIDAFLIGLNLVTDENDIPLDPW